MHRNKQSKRRPIAENLQPGGDSFLREDSLVVPEKPSCLSIWERCPPCNGGRRGLFRKSSAGKFSHNASGGGFDNPSESPFGDPPPFTQGRLSPSVLAFARTAPSSEGANETLRYYTGRRCVKVSVANVILRKFSAGKFSRSTVHG